MTPWSAGRVAFVRENWPTMTARQIGAQLGVSARRRGRRTPPPARHAWSTGGLGSIPGGSSEPPLPPGARNCIATGRRDGRRCVFLAGLYRAEREIAAKLRALGSGNPPWPPIDADRAIPWVENRTKLKLARSQIEAVRVRSSTVATNSAAFTCAAVDCLSPTCRGSDEL